MIDKAMPRKESTTTINEDGARELSGELAEQLAASGTTGTTPVHEPTRAPLALGGAHHRQQTAGERDQRWRSVEAAMRRNGHQAGGLIETLHAVQRSYGYIDQAAMRAVAAALTVPLSKVYGVATFYHFFHLKPKGRHTCVVCLGTACYIKGATATLEGISAEFAIKTGETSADDRLSLLTARCVGACGQAPAVMVDDKVIGQATTGTLLEYLGKLNGERREGRQ